LRQSQLRAEEDLVQSGPPGKMLLNDIKLQLRLTFQALYSAHFEEEIVAVTYIWLLIDDNTNGTWILPSSTKLLRFDLQV